MLAFYLVVTVHVFVCLFLIIVVLLQSAQSGDLAAAFGGQGSQTAFGPRGATTIMAKITTWCAIIFVVTSITLSIMESKKLSNNGSVLSGQKPAPQQSQPAKK